MKNKLILLVVAICVLWTHKSLAQISVVLEEDLDKKSTTERMMPYNMSLSEVSFITTTDTFFLSKIDKYEFLLTNDKVSKIQSSNDSTFQIVVESSNYRLQFCLERKELKRYVPKLYIEFAYFPHYKVCNVYIRDYNAISKVILADEIRKKPINKKIYR